MAISPSSGKRLAFLDWTRGFAACIMLQGHVFQSFAHKDLRSDSPYVLSQFFGGLTPAVFLFVTGVTLAFLMDSQSRKQPSAWRRVVAAIYRARYLLLIGLAFRLQLWMTAFGQSDWHNVFKVDMLNCMAATMLVLAPLALLNTRERLRFGALAGLFIALASPFISQIGFTWIHPFLRDYFVPNANCFPIFPWGAFLAFGISCGSGLRLIKEEDTSRAMQWAALGGIVLIIAARFAADLPFSLYPQSDFWLNGPTLIFIKTGVILLIAGWAFLLNNYINPNGWSFVRQLGITSLLVYWVHTGAGLRPLAGRVEGKPERAADRSHGAVRDCPHGPALRRPHRLEGIPRNPARGPRMVGFGAPAAGSTRRRRLSRPSHKQRHRDSMTEPPP